MAQKKIKNSNIIGNVMAGGANAVYDQFLGKYIPEVGGVELNPIVKMGLGFLAPKMISSKTVQSIGDGLMVCGVSDLVKSMAFGNATTSTGVSGITYVSGTNEGLGFNEYKKLFASEEEIETVEEPKNINHVG